jgi:GntR family transcriptional regulator / MocR family aminotransferase
MNRPIIRFIDWTTMARGKTPVPLDLPQLAAMHDADGSVATKQERAYLALRDAILEGFLTAGARLPSTRMLAERWQLSRGTVENVFDRLRAEGYVTRLGGSGTRVSAVIPDTYLRSASAGSSPRMRRVATKPRKKTEEAGARVGVPFVAKLANPALFSTSDWVRHVQRAISAASLDELCSAEPSGMAVLREAIAGYLRAHRGIACSADEIIVTTGIRHSIDLVSRSMLKPGDKVCVEDPGYRAVHQIFELAGAALIYAPVDKNGIDIDAIRRSTGIRLAYVTPAHQSPLGVTMSASRRLALLDWASANDAWVIEDDYDSEFNYQSSPLPALKSIDRSERVIYCGSFNQALFSNLRIGYMLAPPKVRESVLSLWRTIGRSVGVTEQLGLAEFIGKGALARHLRVARIEYLKLRDIVIEALEKHAAGRYRITGAEAGFHFVLWLPPGCSEDAFREAAGREGIVLQTMGSLCHKVRMEPAVVIGYTAMTVSEVRLAARKLGRLVASFP